MCTEPTGAAVGDAAASVACRYSNSAGGATASGGANEKSSGVDE